ADDPRRGLEGDVARRADERLLRRAGARPDRGREPGPLAPHRPRRHGPARRPAAPPVNIRVRPERGLDVAEAWVGDRQIAWLSGRGDLAWNGDWTASWGGGLVTTCGLDNVGRASEGVGLHGTYTSLPARDGVIEDPRGLRVERRITTDDSGLR